ncbi:MAG TPA: transglutaminase-like cysteine peptidase [Rhizomicrobium sp.]|nr:transglutaminase-like cysteine peptidase [Rhizomicrobium sp.]
MRRPQRTTPEYHRALRGVAVAGALLVATPAGALDLAPSAASFEPAGDSAKAPEGWNDFCEHYDAPACRAAVSDPRDIDATGKLMAQLTAVNDWVNAWVKPESDQAHWGVKDRWDYPIDGYGDCEDYVLLKQLLLTSAGVPQEDLLITVVLSHGDAGHAVLTVHTRQGDYILDSQKNDVMPWSRSGYRFVKRQSRNDPNDWVYIDGVSSTQPIVVADMGD